MKRNIKEPPTKTAKHTEVPDPQTKIKTKEDKNTIRHITFYTKET